MAADEEVAEELGNTAMTLPMAEALGTAPTFSNPKPSLNPHPDPISFPNPNPLAIEECPEVESDGGSCSGAPIGGIEELGTADESVIVN